MMGMCQRGDNCPYSHDRTISNKGTLPCRFYQAGTCANGTNCRFSHGQSISPEETELSLAVEAFGLEDDPQQFGDLGGCQTVVLSDGSESSYDPSGAPGYDSQLVFIDPVSEYVATQPLVMTTTPVYHPALISPTFYPPEEFVVQDFPLDQEIVIVDQEVEEQDQMVDPPVMVPLPGSAPWKAPSNWAEAKEFVPKVEKPKSWAQVANTGLEEYPGCELSISEASSLVCPFYRVGECRYGAGCAYIHGQQCDYCGQACLHPTHLDQRRAHLAECLREHERDMELSFAVARSKEKTCGICMETVLDKPKGEARFGILPSCNHCFCLPCIRKWRQAKQFEHKIIRACPECRQTSDYICPSRFWVETSEEKERLLSDYKKNLGQKECKYFNKGAGECPFGNKCFYQHADKDGRSVDVGPPKKPLRRANADGNLTLVQRLLLYDFLEERDGQLVLPLDFVELLDLYSDSEDWSDSETNE